MISQAAASSPRLLKLDDLEEGSTQLEFQVRAEEIDLRAEFFSFPQPLLVTLRVRCALENFAVDGRIRAVIKGECCRCLAEVEKPLEASLKLLFQRKQISEEEREAMAEEEELEIIAPGVQVVDLGDRLRDTVVLELPVRIYCREDCRGLCSRCGMDLNAGTCSCQEGVSDPRWEALKKIRL